jgi:hypothetical protein
MLVPLPLCIARAQLLIVCAKYDAAWLGEGKSVERDSKGQFTSSLNRSLERKSDRAIAQLTLELSGETQKAAGTQLASPESKAQQQEIRAKLARRGLEKVFDEACLRLTSALKSGTVRQEIEDLLQEFEDEKLGVVAAIAWALPNESIGEWLETFAQSLDRQPDKAFVRGLKPEE